MNWHAAAQSFGLEERETPQSVHKCRSGASAKGGDHIAADSFILLSLCRHWGGRGEDSQASGSFFEKKEPKKLLSRGYRRSTSTAPAESKVFCALFFKKALLTCLQNSQLPINYIYSG